MSTDQGPNTRDGALARAIVHCYPPSWRSRYETEFLATMADLRLTPRTALDAFGGGLAAWILPCQGVSRDQRMRSTLSVVWSAWIVLVGGLLFFAQMTEDAPFKSANTAKTPLAVLYDTCVAAGIISALALAVGGAPILARTARDALRQRRFANTALLALPVGAPVVFVALLIAAARLWRHAGARTANVPTVWGVVLIAVGLGVAALCAWAPGRVLRRTEIRGRLYRSATIAAVPMAGAIIVSWLASVGYAIALRSDAAPLDATVSRPAPLIAYALIMGLAAVVAAVSSSRGVRALRRPDARTTCHQQHEPPCSPDARRFDR